MLESFFDPDFWRKQALTAEANAVVDVASGQKSIDEAGTDYLTSQVSGNLLDSGTDALHGATNNVDAAVNNVNPALESTPEMVGPMQPPPVNQAFPNDTSMSNQANIKINDNAIPGPQFDSYGGPTTSPANLPTPEEPGTFLGLEGKDYTKIGLQGAMAAGVGALKPTQQVQSSTPAGPGITKGTVMQPQGGMAGVNSMTQPVNSMQMTQAQGLISPFQRDLYRRRGY